MSDPTFAPTAKTADHSHDVDRHDDDATGEQNLASHDQDAKLVNEPGLAAVVEGGASHDIEVQ